MLVLAAMAAIQIIKPLGWPGLERRQDAWKLAVGGLLIVVALLALKPAFFS